MTLLARRYATALHLAAKERGEQDRVLSELQALHAAVADPVVRDLMTSPELGLAQREAIADKLAKGRSELFGNFLRVVLHRRRHEVLFDVYPAFRAIVMAERGQIEGRVETPRPLGEVELDQLRALAKKLSGKDVELSVAIRPELIGGVRLYVGNELYDGSVKTALEQLEQQLLQASV